MSDADLEDAAPAAYIRIDGVATEDLGEELRDVAHDVHNRLDDEYDVDGVVPVFRPEVEPRIRTTDAGDEDVDEDGAGDEPPIQVSPGVFLGGPVLVIGLVLLSAAFVVGNLAVGVFGAVVSLGGALLSASVGDSVNGGESE